MKTKNISLLAMLSTIIVISGLIKIPSIVPGAEFQLSAPLAVVICAIFGFRRYITAGIVASIISFVIGAANINNIIVAMIFRIVVGLVIALFGVKMYTLIISGPLGTAFARLVLSFILGVEFIPLVTTAIFGMLMTAVVSPLIYSSVIRIVKKSAFAEYAVKSNNKFEGETYG